MTKNMMLGNGSFNEIAVVILEICMPIYPTLDTFRQNLKYDLHKKLGLQRSVPENFGFAFGNLRP